jgi:hypothetical protein
MAHIPEQESERLTAMKSRRLTVSYTHPESRAVRARELLPPMPFLRLQGRWLDEAGFTIGANVRVTGSAGRLVVEVIGSKPDRR